jgi:hypothetical protein
MKSEIITVTPAIAESWLKKNTRNRRINDRTVRNYAEEMLSGAWKQNGASIQFDRSGKLLDGQHRLSAIVKTRTTHDMVVVSGLDPEVFDTIDLGKGRTTVDTLDVKNIANFPRVAKALPVILAHVEGVTRRPFLNIRPNHILATLKEYSDLPDALEELGSVKPLLLQRSFFDGLYYLFRRSDATLALEYMEALRDGKGVETMDCWHRLRERLMRNQIAATHKLSDVHTCALVIKAWNCARTGIDAKNLRWNPANEAYPEIV